MTTDETNATLFNKHCRAVKTPTEQYKPSLWQNFKWWWELNNPLSASLTLTDADEYINMPRKQRTLYGFWYVHAYITGGHVILGCKKERNKLDTFLRKHYPVQRWCREVAYWKIYLAVDHCSDWVRHTLNPRQKWLTKQIPKCWSDKPRLITELNFAMVIDFVDGEKCFENTEYEDGGVHQKFAEELRDCYDYIKNRRPKLQKDHDNSYPDGETMTGDFNVDYAEEMRLELLISSEDTKYLVWIMTNRDFLWT